MEPLRPHQQREAALTLAEAFASDPLLEILAPDPGRRVKLGPPMMSVLLAYGMRYGRVWSTTTRPRWRSGSTPRVAR
jgi:hypothetical protein